MDSICYTCTSNRSAQVHFDAAAQFWPRWSVQGGW
jgi:hypothetical protein